MVARTTALTIATIFALSNSNGELILPLILLGIVIGLVLGYINGVLVTYTHANPFVITFGIASILRGIDLTISQTPNPRYSRAVYEDLRCDDWHSSG